MVALSARDKAARRRPVPLPVKGRYRRIKTVVAGLLLGLFFLVPWIRWDRGGDMPGQAVMFDVPGRRFFFFGLEFWPQDLPLVLGLMVLGALGLFLATTISGRVWCGFTCPQTVWTDLFFTGDRLADRIAGKGTPAAKALRQVFWIGLSLLTGFGFAAWFTDVTTLPGRLLGGGLSSGLFGTVAVLTATTWALAGYARERVCLHMCPWPRFQSALLDADTLVVTYDAGRGEPRGKKRLPLRADLGGPGGDTARGDCVDCNKCFAVCPTGVDIRDGLQMGCIGCGLCIDACDDVMGKLGRPGRLIDFASEAGVVPKPRRLLPRPKILIFGAAMMVTLALLGYGLFSVQKVTVDLQPQRNPPFVRLSDGSVRNDYLLRVDHRLPALAAVAVSVEGLPGATVRFGESEGPTLALGEDRSGSDRLMITLPRAALDTAGLDADGHKPITLVLTDAANGRVIERENSYFWGPP